MPNLLRELRNKFYNCFFFIYFLKVAVKVLPFYANYFGIAYNLPKCDMIAVTELSFGELNIN